jgi:hypothetical protein
MRNRLIGHRDLRAEKCSISKRSFGIFRIEKMSEEGRFAGSSRTIIAGNKSIGMSESPATI